MLFGVEKASSKTKLYAYGVSHLLGWWHLNEAGKKIVFVSAVHDFRMLKRGSIQALALGLAKSGHAVTFISLRFSLFSLIKRDSRSFLWRRTNRPETVDGVVCYLWFTLIHPFHSRNLFLKVFFRPYYFFHRRLRNRFLDDRFRDADYIVIESGLGLLFTERARGLNPHAKIIYRASDKLSTIGASEVLQAELEKSADIFDWYCLLSADMIDEFAWVREKCFLLPQGIDPAQFENTGPNPYTAPENAVSVGSMLFDPEFFKSAAARFPDIQFHVIGCATTFDAPANVRLYDEMPFKDTLRYIEYASFGVAPYRATPNAEYLGTSSLKLKQYEYFGIPAVCPMFAVGPSQNRFGYNPGDPATIQQAVDAARGSQFVPILPSLNWQELGERLLDPRGFPDCDLRVTVTNGLGAETGLERRRIFPMGTMVSLVTCTVGERKRQLARLLRSLAQQQFRSFELIVVDQNPPGYLDELLQAEGAGLALKHVRSARGLSVARNVGLAHASGDIIGFPDDDCWYLPDTLDQVTEFFDANPRIGTLLGRTVDNSGSPSLSPLRPESGSVNKDNVWTSGNSNTLFVRTSALPAAGGFDEQIGVGAPTRFQSGEETDFILKLLHAGVPAIYISQLKVGHDQVEDRGLSQSVSRAWKYSQGFGYVLKTHDFGFAYVLYRFGRSVLSAGRAMLRFQMVYALSRMIWGLGTLVGYAATPKA